MEIGHDQFIGLVDPDTAFWSLVSKESLAEAMGDRVWLADRASKLVDEHPDAYKDIDQVMADQADLVTVRARLTQILNYKGC